MDNLAKPSIVVTASYVFHATSDVGTMFMILLSMNTIHIFRRVPDFLWTSPHHSTVFPHRYTQPFSGRNWAIRSVPELCPELLHPRVKCVVGSQVFLDLVDRMDHGRMVTAAEHRTHLDQ